ncbi:MAG: hypothetical protein ACLQVD_05160 [Capsulimonadaceae bacterium]
MPEIKIQAAVSLIRSVPGYAGTAARILRVGVRYVPGLVDRGQTTLRGRILVGPQALGPSNWMEPALLIGLCGTLVHEEYHTRQPLILKTVSTWAALLSGAHPMARYEWAAYDAQLGFLKALREARPDLTDLIRQEYAEVLRSAERHYGPR